MIGDVRLEPARPADLPLIAECVHRFRLDDEELAAEQFVVARKRGRLVAFGGSSPTAASMSSARSASSRRSGDAALAG